MTDPSAGDTVGGSDPSAAVPPTVEGLQATLAALPGTVLLTHADGRLAYVSPNADLIGHDAGTLWARRSIDALLGGGRTHEGLTAAAPVEGVVATVLGADGAAHPVVLSVAPVECGDAAFVYHLREPDHHRDPEDQRAVLDQKRRHALRNKLNVILGLAAAVEPDDEATYDALTAISDAADELLMLSEKTRAFGDRLPSDPTSLEPLDAAALVEGVLEELETVYPDATIEVTAPPVAWAAANGALELAVSELIENAIEHAQRFPPRVTVELGVRDDVVTVSIADDGPGLPAPHRATLLGEADAPLVGGDGVGLWLVRWSVDAMGGDVDVTDTEDGGTVVEVSLSRAEPPGT